MSAETRRTWLYFRSFNGRTIAAWLTFRMRWNGCSVPQWWLDGTL